MRIAAEIGARREALGEHWCLPGGGPLSGRQAADIAGRYLGRQVKLRSAGMTTLRMKIGLSMPVVESRATERITIADLERLSDIARSDRDWFFEHYPKYARYQSRVACVALCQGAALHFIDGKTGIKDLDVWTFYYELPSTPFPYRRHARKDFGISHLTNWSRRVDLMARALPVQLGTDPAKMLCDYLTKKPTKSSVCLAKKAVVLIDPPSRRGEIVWLNDKITIAHRGAP
jgi:hypothetical protein